MGFNPLDHEGIPLEDQFRNWRELSVEPLAPRPDDPYTLTRVILMNGIEVEAAMFSHQFSRHTDNPEIKPWARCCPRRRSTSPGPGTCANG